MCARFDGRMLAEHRQLDVAHLGEVSRRAQVLGQARAAEREAGLQVGRRDVELRVLADEVHHLERVDAERLAQPRRLVGERDLQRVEVVAAYFTISAARIEVDVELARQVAEELPQRLHRRRRRWRPTIVNGGLS